MTNKHKIQASVYHLFVCVLGLVMIYPVLWMVSGSLKNNAEILNGGMNLIPPQWRFSNFFYWFSGFWRHYLSNLFFFSNSFFCCICIYACNGSLIILCCLCLFQGEF